MREREREKEEPRRKVKVGFAVAIEALKSPVQNCRLGISPAFSPELVRKSGAYVHLPFKTTQERPLSGRFHPR